MGFLSIQSITPPGVVLPFAGNTAPDGWLLCQGQLVSTVTYAALFAAIGYTYGGSGANFNLPDTRGIFLRGSGSQTIDTIVYSSTLGNKQKDQIQGHRHDYLQDATGGGSVGPQNVTNARLTSYSPGLQVVGNPSNDGSNGDPRVGSETRPANISVNYIIKL